LLTANFPQLFVPKTAGFSLHNLALLCQAMIPGFRSFSTAFSLNLYTLLIVRYSQDLLFI